MSRLTRDSILAAGDLPQQDVDVPEWGGTVGVRTMTGAERDAWEQSMVTTGKKPNLVNMRARLVAACTVDDTGALLFTYDDVEALGKKSAAALQRVVLVAQKLNGLTDEALEEARGN